MSRILAALAALILFATIDAGRNASRSADAWGCSYEKCLEVCGKTGGTRCSAYCSKHLKDKQSAKICK